jgi:ankyrin repeat protein
MATGDPLLDFIEAAVWHGPLDRAETLLAEQPGLATSGIHAAAILGDDTAVRRFLAADTGNATARQGPYGADALNLLCLSRYLRLDPARSPAFLRATTALLDAGANPNTGFWTTGACPEFETALYGAAGVAHHPEMTRLLLERGADPNDGEAVYHSPEGYDNGAMQLLVETGRLTADSLAMMLIRKHDWHDYEGVKWLLEHGVDPNHPWRRGWAINHAIARDNGRDIIELLLHHGADPTVLDEGSSAVARAARRGRGDLLELFEGRGVSTALDGPDRLIAACARNDGEAIRSIVDREPSLVKEALSGGGQLLAEFAGTGNTGGVARLLDLGVPVDALFEAGDGYWDVARNSTALHVAAWRARHGTVQRLIERGAPIHARDGKGRTPLMLAVKACVDSYWSDRRSPESVAALRRAGASAEGIAVPTGYPEADALLR